MFVVSKRNIILPGPNGEKFRMPKDYMGPVPAWAEDSAYLKALADDGKIIISESGTDKDFAKNAKNPKKNGKKTPPEKDRETSSEAPEAPAPEDAQETPDAVAE